VEVGSIVHHGMQAIFCALLIIAGLQSLLFAMLCD
jgi:hypothetical protein